MGFNHKKIIDDYEKLDRELDDFMDIECHCHTCYHAIFILDSMWCEFNGCCVTKKDRCEEHYFKSIKKRNEFEQMLDQWYDAWELAFVLDDEEPEYEPTTEEAKKLK